MNIGARNPGRYLALSLLTAGPALAGEPAPSSPAPKDWQYVGKHMMDDSIDILGYQAKLAKGAAKPEDLDACKKARIDFESLGPVIDELIPKTGRNLLGQNEGKEYKKVYDKLKTYTCPETAPPPPTVAPLAPPPAPQRGFFDEVMGGVRTLERIVREYVP